MNKDMATSIKSFGNANIEKRLNQHEQNNGQEILNKVQVNVKINQKNINIKTENHS
jgi:hypothetical protein